MTPRTRPTEYAAVAVFVVATVGRLLGWSDGLVADITQVALVLVPVVTWVASKLSWGPTGS